ncbi:hypothetical protein L7F22_014168 [Adiantum nelumboides]|nr:hypothetical protein [Adiantum nelumboides]
MMDARAKTLMIHGMSPSIVPQFISHGMSAQLLWQRLQSSYGRVSSVKVAKLEEDMDQLCILELDNMVEKIGDLLQLLDVQPDEKLLPTTYGKLRPPLGSHRLKFVSMAPRRSTQKQKDTSRPLQRRQVVLENGSLRNWPLHSPNKRVKKSKHCVFIDDEASVDRKARRGEACNQRYEEQWDPIWQKVNTKFERKLVGEWKDLCGKAFFVWDGNHRVKTWLRRIKEVHSKEEKYHVLVCCQFIEVDKRKEAELILSLDTKNEATATPNLGHKIFMFQKIGLTNKQSIMDRLMREQRNWMEVEL